MIKQKIFKNGIRLIYKKTKDKWASFQLGVNCGSINENPNEFGLAHFLEHLFFKSTKTRKTKELLETLDALGAHTNAFTDHHLTCYYYKSLTENFEKCFNVYFDMFTNGAFYKDEVDAERKVILEEISLYEDRSWYNLSDKCDGIIFDGTPYAHPILGERSIIKNTSIDEILAFKQKHYTSNNLVISIAGGVSFKKVVNLINNTFCKVFNTQKEPFKIEKKEYKQKLSQKILNIQKKDSQANLVAYFKGVSSDDPQYHAQTLYVYMMSGGMSSRLFSYLREEHGYCYDTRIIKNLSNDNLCYLGFYVGTNPNNVKNCIDGFKFLVNEAAKKGFTEAELQKAKNQIKTNMLTKTNPSNIASRNLSTMFKYGKIKTVDETIKQLDSVSLDDIKKFAQKISRQKNIFVGCIGNKIDDSCLEY